MSARADQLVLEYLSRVADIAHQRLRSDERLDFMTRLRARIEQLCREAGATDAAAVGKVIDRFGDPGYLVERERQRLAAAGRPDPPGAARPAPAAPATAPGPQGTRVRVEPVAGPGAGAGPAGAPGAGTDLAGLLARRRRELLALLLLGPAALAVPLLFWPAGAVVAGTSRVWRRGEKWLGLGLPPLVTLAGIIGLGASTQHPDLVVDLAAYREAVGAGYPVLGRICALAGAAFLAWRLLRAGAAPAAPAAPAATGRTAAPWRPRPAAAPGSSRPAVPPVRGIGPPRRPPGGGPGK